MIRPVAFAAVLLAALSAPLQAATYTLEPNYTQGVVRWDHLGFSNPTAQFGQSQGTLEFDPMHPQEASVKVTIPLSSLSTGVPDLDDDFRSADFFDTARFPTATFTSTGVKKASMSGHLQVSGTLDLHGVTRPVTLDVVLIKVGTNARTNLPTAGFQATAMLKRSDFGLGKYVPQVGDDIHIDITSQGAEAKAYADYNARQAAREAAEQQAAAKH